MCVRSLLLLLCSRVLLRSAAVDGAEGVRVWWKSAASASVPANANEPLRRFGFACSRAPDRRLLSAVKPKRAAPPGLRLWATGTLSLGRSINALLRFLLLMVTTAAALRELPLQWGKPRKRTTFGSQSDPIPHGDLVLQLLSDLKAPSAAHRTQMVLCSRLS